MIGGPGWFLAVGFHGVQPQLVQLSGVAGSREAGAFEAALRGSVRGAVRFDRLARTIYSTDASIYEITPRGVVCPTCVEDVVEAVRVCRAHGVAVVARGGGTGLTGGAVGSGVLLDLSRHMNRIGPIDAAARTVEVEPGVVLDELNARLAPHGLTFAPDVATSSRATIGGMIANNSCGARSVRYGRTVDHVASVRMVLADGSPVTFVDAAEEGALDNPRAADIERGLGAVRDAYNDEIARRFPKVLRSNGGYGLDRLGSPGRAARAVKIICGSEGTLGVVVGATLRLVPIPRAIGMAVLHFDDLFDALRVVPEVLAHAPSTIELIDKLILDAGRARAGWDVDAPVVAGDPQALLVVEFEGDHGDEVRAKLEALAGDAAVSGSARVIEQVLDERKQAAVWNLRKSGLGLLMSKPGDEQPYSFVEDTAVDPARLAEYIERFARILEREGVLAGYYAHASVGCIHVKPVLNLKSSDDVERMRRIAEAVCDLAVAFGGTMTGEHGDGLVRSCWLERLYGPKIIEAFGAVKRVFDPDGLMNPGKIVDPLPMTEHLRYGAAYESRSPQTHLDFSAHGGLSGMADMCVGVGQCRQRLVGTMCPSYMATGDETHTTRARANALRVALSNRGLLEGLADGHLEEVMDLCLSCKACKTECPTGVDMARMKAEYLSHRNLRSGVGRRARLVADTPEWLALAGYVPRLANLVGQSGLARRWMQARYGIDRRVAPPRLATRTFRSWFRRHRRRYKTGGVCPRGPVVYFVDTWTNYITPNVGIAAVALLERAGFEVHCPTTYCCGRPAISQGLLSEAKQLAEFNVRLLTQSVPGYVPIVGTEPSCLLTLVDEYPQLVRAPVSKHLASRCYTIEAFLERLLREDPAALTFDPRRGRYPLHDERSGHERSGCGTSDELSTPARVLFHGHCHQKAMIGTGDAMALLRRAFGSGAREIDSGCCGMAGSFGHELEHYEVARAVGEQRLFPAVRDRGNALIAVTGFSCRHQIAHHTGAAPRHVVEHLADWLCDPARQVSTDGSAHYRC